MLLIKHAARLLIVNQIQFVPQARCEWASPPRTKVSEQPCQSWTKGPRHHFYLPQPELLQLAGSHWMRCYPGRFPGRCSRDVQSKPSCTLPRHLFFFTQWHLGRNKALHQNSAATPLQAIIMLLPAQTTHSVKCSKSVSFFNLVRLLFFILHGNSFDKLWKQINK